MDPDPDADPDLHIFLSDLQDVIEKDAFFPSFFAYYFVKVHLHHFFKDKNHKEVTKQYGRNQCFIFYFSFMIKVSGSVSLTNGSGSRRRLQNFLIRLQILGFVSKKSIRKRYQVFLW
jgi:hypothetical protein